MSSENRYGEMRREARKCIEIHSHLSTSLYDWAVAHTLYERNILCWSTTVAYYAMMHSARTLFSLIEFDSRFESVFNARQKKQEHLKKIMTYHQSFCDFLQNKRLNSDDSSLRNLCVECFSDYFPVRDWNVFLGSIGNVLDLHKKARESENYEHFVVAHHGREYHYESPFVETLFLKSEEHANCYIPQILGHIFKFYEIENPMLQHHLWHLKDELWWFDKTLTDERLSPSNEMVVFLTSLRRLLANVKRPADFEEFERETDMEYYSEKNKVYKELNEIATGISRIATSI